MRAIPFAAGWRRLWRGRAPARLVACDSGSAAVEFALLLPAVLLPLFIGITEVGRLVFHHHVVEKSIRDTARFLARTPDPRATADVDAAKTLALHGTLDSSAPLLLPYWSSPGSVQVTVTDIDNTTGDFRGPGTLMTVRVTATVPFSSGVLNLIGMSNSFTFSVSHEERHIGQ